VRHLQALCVELEQEEFERIWSSSSGLSRHTPQSLLSSLQADIPTLLLSTYGGSAADRLGFHHKLQGFLRAQPRVCAVRCAVRCADVLPACAACPRFGMCSAVLCRAVLWAVT
jgi:hypothetical protein